MARERIIPAGFDHFNVGYPLAPCSMIRHPQIADIVREGCHLRHRQQFHHSKAESNVHGLGNCSRGCKGTIADTAHDAFEFAVDTTGYSSLQPCQIHGRSATWNFLWSWTSIPVSSPE